MNNQTNARRDVPHKAWPKARPYGALVLSLMAAALLSACANYSGISSDKKMIAPSTLSQQPSQSLPWERGQWPTVDWATQFGDRQLAALIAEAIQTNPSLEEARARVNAAAALTETAYAKTLPNVGVDVSSTRQKYTSTALVPPPYAGSWQTENKALLSGAYELDLWGKNSAAWKSSVSKLRASQAEQEKVKLTLSASIA